jgi:hypothetical protein
MFRVIRPSRKQLPQRRRIRRTPSVPGRPSAAIRGSPPQHGETVGEDLAGAFAIPREDEALEGRARGGCRCVQRAGVHPERSPGEVHAGAARRRRATPPFPTDGSRLNDEAQLPTEEGHGHPLLPDRRFPGRDGCQLGHLSQNPRFPIVKDPHDRLPRCVARSVHSEPAAGVDGESDGATPGATKFELKRRGAIAVVVLPAGRHDRPRLARSPFTVNTDADTLTGDEDPPHRRLAHR